MLERTLILAGAGVLAGLAAGCGVSDAGPHTTQSRAVPAFHRVQLDGSPHVVIRRGSHAALTVSGGRNRVHDLITQVRSGTLTIKPRDASATVVIGDPDVTITAITPSLRAARVNGSGDVTAVGVSEPRLRAKVNGSGAVDATGNVSEVDGVVAGSGHLRLGKLVARRGRIAIVGSGRAAVNARQALDASVHGAGHIRYRGQPRIVKSVSGSGAITR